MAPPQRNHCITIDWPIFTNTKPAHAKGKILTGTFKPSSTASQLSTAPHFASASTPVWVRFSNSTGIPNIPDYEGNADPRGIAVRFQLGDRKHTDIVGHSTPFFPVRTGELFLEFLQAIGASSTHQGDGPSPVQEFLGKHPSALAHVSAPNPAPSSFARQQYWPVSAYKLVNKEGKETYIRYQIVPEAGVETLTAEQVKEKDADFLQTEIVERVSRKEETGFKILAQIAEEGDVTDDATVHWPEDRKVVELGSFDLTELLNDNEKEQKYAIFDPIPRVEGIEPSADPLLEMRAAIYLISGRQRRAA